MVSVCLASYNGAFYIKDQINSILQQLNANDELIISDDSSTDFTVQIIKSFRDKRIILLENNKFRNPTKNFENALLHAKGDFIILCDQDDIWLNNKIEVSLKFLITFDLIVSDCNIVDCDLGIISESYLTKVKGKIGLVRNLFFRTSPYIGCCMAFKRNVLIKALPFPKNIKDHDFWIAMVAEAFFKTFMIYEPLILYRRHQDNVSNTGNKSTNSLYKKFIKRTHIIISLLKLIN